VKDLDLPKSMKRAMARQAEAERERRAKVINAQGELQASETLAQAARTLAIEPSAFQLRYLQTATEIAAEHTSTTIFPIPIELFRPFIHAAATGVATSAPPQIKVGSAALPPQLQNVLTPGEGEAGGAGARRQRNAEGPAGPGPSLVHVITK
jgi:hypothetical protein